MVGKDKARVYITLPKRLIKASRKIVKEENYKSLSDLVELTLSVYYQESKYKK